MKKQITKENLSYAATGVNYEVMDPVKRLAQKEGKKTAKNLKRFGMSELSESRGESSYVWEDKNSYHAFVMEGLGTKNRVADAVRIFSGKTHYDAIAQDTVAMIVNDLIVVGASPQIVSAYFAVGSSDWFADTVRAQDLVRGWAKACDLSGAVWGGGETPTLKNIVEADTIDLAGSAVGIISPKKRLTMGDHLQSGDSIVLIESSGIHANGITLAREVAAKLPDGYATRLSNGMSYGEAILRPTHIYAAYIESLFEAGVDIHYMVHITGHGWRKLMRATQTFSYILDRIPPVDPLFQCIQTYSGNNSEEMYGNFNMGAGFALYIPKKYEQIIQNIAGRYGLKTWVAGHIESGPKQVIIPSEKIIFSEHTLRVR